MILRDQRRNIDRADELICAEIDTLRQLAQSSTWQGCAETNEIEALRALAGLLTVRQRLVEWQREHGAD